MFSLAVLLASALPTIVVHAPRVDLSLEVARTEPVREYGLMNRKTLAPHTGMIFVFRGDGPIGFWMKNTLVPLDMIFVAADGTVRRVFANVAVVSPKTADADIPHEDGVAKYVIELNAGEAAKDGIVPGTKLDLRAVPAAQ